MLNLGTKEFYEGDVLKKLEEINYETRIKIARSWIQDRSLFNKICKDSGLNSTAKKNVGPLYDQYGEPSLRDTSMTPNSSLPKIDPPIQEMIIVIILNHPHLTTKEVRNLLWGEGLNIDPAPIQRFLKQAGLGTEELRNQYLEELRGLKNSRSTRGLQKFAYKRFGSIDGTKHSEQYSGVDKHHYLAIEVNPKLMIDYNKSVALIVMYNLHSHIIEIFVIDTYLGTIKGYSRALQAALQSLPFADFSFFKYLLWHESLPDGSQALPKRVFLDSDSEQIHYLNNSFRKWYSDKRLSFGDSNEYFERKINLELGFLKKFKEIIKLSREYHSQAGNTDQVALDYSIDKVREFVNEYNSEVINRIPSVSSPQSLEERRGANLPKNPIVKYSAQLDGWLRRNKEQLSRLQKSPR